MSKIDLPGQLHNFLAVRKAFIYRLRGVLKFVAIIFTQSERAACCAVGQKAADVSAVGKACERFLRGAAGNVERVSRIGNHRKAFFPVECEVFEVQNLTFIVGARKAVCHIVHHVDVAERVVAHRAAVAKHQPFDLIVQ